MTQSIKHTYLLYLVFVQPAQDHVYLYVLTICENQACLHYATVDGERSRRSTAVSVFPPLGPHLRSG